MFQKIPLFIVGSVVLIAIVGAGGYWYMNNQNSNEIAACTMEAKECPDGSYARRQGPNCEFAACPGGTLRSVPTPSPTLQTKNPITEKTFSTYIIFKYGVGAKNVLDTYADTYTKDMVIDPLITVPLHLSQDERSRILAKINELHVFDQERPMSRPIMMSPCSSYYLKLHMDSLDKELSWSNCGGETIAPAWATFSDFMISLIQSKDEYKKLPPAKSGYL